MSSDAAHIELLSTIKAVDPESNILYRLFRMPSGYGLSACIVGEPDSEVCIAPLTTDHTAAEQVFTLLAENLVFPYHIYEVLDDLLATDPDLGAHTV